MSDLFRFAQLQPYTLAGAGAIIGDTTIILKSMKDIDGNALTMSGTFGDIGFGTLEPGSGTREEQICWTGLTNNANGTTTLSGVKSVTFTYPYTQTSGLLKTHAGAANFIVSNTAGFYDKLTSKSDDETISGLWTFTQLPQSSAVPTVGIDLTNKTYVDGVAIAGAPNADDVTKGIVQLATRAQMAAGTILGTTGAHLVLTAERATSVGAGGTTVAVITQSNGTIAPSFIDQTGNYTWTGTSTLAGTTIISGSTTMAGVTISGTTTMSGTIVGVYDYQVFTASGTWTKPSNLLGTEMVKVQLWGAGGGGGSGANKNGGGGGAYFEAMYRASDLTSTVAVTVATAPAAGVDGGNSSFGAYGTAYGGGHGNTTNTGGGGGGYTSAGVANAPGGPIPGTSTTDTTFGGGYPATNAGNAKNTIYGGAGGGFQANTVGATIYGGGGGGGQIAGSTSLYGGTGGTGNGSGGGSAGSAPGGGGGGGSTTGGAGGRGECRVWLIK